MVKDTKDRDEKYELIKTLYSQFNLLKFYLSLNKKRMYI